MQTVTLKINDSFYEHFMAIVDSLPKKQVKVVDKKYLAALSSRVSKRPNKGLRRPRKAKA
jgi:hypothetical protein